MNVLFLKKFVTFSPVNLMKIYLQDRVPESQLFTLDSDYWVHYLTNVRRLRSGEIIEVAGPERVLTTEILDISPFKLKKISSRPSEKPGYQLWMLQALTRKKKFETTVKLGAELGVTDFLPLLSDYTVRQPKNPSRQVERWSRIALDSSRITGRDWTPRIHQPVDFSRFPAKTADVEEFFYGDPDGANPAESFPGSVRHVAIIIGPEGAFSSEEKNFLEQLPATPVTLGPKILRSETAAVAMATLWLHYLNS